MYKWSEGQIHQFCHMKSTMHVSRHNNLLHQREKSALQSHKFHSLFTYPDEHITSATNLDQNLENSEETSQVRVIFKIKWDKVLKKTVSLSHISNPSNKGRTYAVHHQLLLPVKEQQTAPIILSWLASCPPSAKGANCPAFLSQP